MATCVQVAHGAAMEKAGVPTATMAYPEQSELFKNIALIRGCPNLRQVAVSRVGTAEERVAALYDDLIAALTDPLTEEEQESGVYEPEPEPRIAFVGTLDEAQDFYQQTNPGPTTYGAPICKYSDGLPIIVPTEEKVAKMLTGTSHDPQELIAHPDGRIIPSTFTNYGTTGVPISFLLSVHTLDDGTIVYSHGAYTATVEQVAIIGVMAGCKPEHMPVLLAMATAGGGSTNCPGTSSMAGTQYIVSGPIANEIGMNAGHEAFDVGNPANMCLGRAASLMTINIARCTCGQLRSDSGNPMHSICIAEDLEGLPGNWVGFNEESTYTDPITGETVNYTKNESVLGKMGAQYVLVGMGHSPGSHRQLWVGKGGLARWLQDYHGWPPDHPGPYNFLEAYIDVIIEAAGMAEGKTFVIHKDLARQLTDMVGFSTKDDVYNWLAGTYTVTEDWYYKHGWWDFFTDAGRAIEPTSGLPYKDLPPDYEFPAFGSPSSNAIIVSDSFGDEHCYVFMTGRPSAYPIDPWR